MNTSYGQITLSKVNDGLDAIGLGMKVNYSSLTRVDNGECYFHGYNDQNEPVDDVGWVMWNGAKITIENGYWINPNSIAPFNTIILHVYRTSGSSAGQRHCDVWWDSDTGKWMGYHYTDTKPTPTGKGEWTWNEATDCILATYVEPSSEGAITSAQLFNPPKKFSELPDPKVGFDFENLEIGGRNLAFNTEGIMYSAIKSEDEDPAVAGDEYCAIDLGRTLPLNDGDAVTVSFDLHMLINTASKAHLQVYNTTKLGTHIIVQSVDVLAGRTFKAGDEINERIIITDTVKTRGVDDVQLGTDWLEFDSGNGTSNWYSISNLKVEAGNRATTWTKAPEDVDDDIGATNNRVDEVQGNIEDIRKTYNDFKGDVNNAFQSADEKADRIAQLANDFDGKYAEKFDELYNYIRFVVPEQGQTDDIFSGVELGPLVGEGESSVQLRVGTVVESGTATNCISFVRGGQRLGWWDGVDFYTGNIKVKVSQRAQFGIFAFIPRRGGSLSFKKVQEPEDIV